MFFWKHVNFTVTTEENYTYKIIYQINIPSYQFFVGTSIFTDNFNEELSRLMHIMKRQTLPVHCQN